MKKKNKTLLLMLAVLVPLGVAVFLLLRNPAPAESDDTSSSSTAAETISVISQTVSDIDSIQVKNAEAEYTMTAEQKPAEGETQASTVFSLKDFDGVDLNVGSISSAAGSILPLTALKQIETPDNLADFGLDGDGEATLKLTYTDGSSETLTVGIASSGTNGRYVMKDGQIYIVSSVSNNFFTSGLSFVNTTVVAIPDIMTTDEAGNAVAGTDVLTSLMLSGKNFPTPITVDENKNDITAMTPNRIFSPVEADVNATTLAEITTALKTLTAVSAVKVDASEKDFAEYGLAEPFVQADYVINGEKHSVKISDVNENGNHYLQADNGTVVYEIAAASVAAWKDVTLTSLRASYIFLANIQSVSKLTFTDGDSILAFDAAREKNEEKSTEEKVQYDIVPSLGGNPIDYTKTYQPMYSAMISLPVLSSDAVSYDKTAPAFSIRYDYFEGGSDVIDFYAIEGQDRYAAELNGNYSGILRKISLTDFIDTVYKASANEVLKAS